MFLLNGWFRTQNHALPIPQSVSGESKPASSEPSKAAGYLGRMLMTRAAFPRGTVLFIAFLCYQYDFSGRATSCIDHVGNATFALGRAGFAPRDAGADLAPAPLAGFSSHTHTFVFHSQSQQNQAVRITAEPARCRTRCLPAESLRCQRRDPLNLCTQHHPHAEPERTAPLAPALPGLHRQ